MPVDVIKPGGGSLSRDDILELLNEVGVDEATRDSIVNFVTKKLVQIPIELVIETLLEVAKGLKKAPAFKIGEEIVVNEAGSGEEAAIAVQQDRERQIREIEEAIRLAQLLRAGGVAMQLILRDP